MDDFEELRRLLLSTEQEELRGLHQRLEDKELRAQEISSVLPQAARLSGERNGELSRVLQPVVGDSVRESIKTQPQVFIEAFHPIIGPIVRRSIAESLRGLMQSLNQSLEHTFSWQGLKWRLEAWRTGRSFAEVVMLRSLIYRVEQIFLIHRETSLLLLHVSADAKTGSDSDLIAAMASAIRDFSHDSLQANEALDEFRLGELHVWLAPGQHAYLAATIQGEPPRELRPALDEAIESAHTLLGTALAKFDGDATVFEPLRPELEACLRAQYKQSEAAEPQLGKAWLAVGILAAMLLAATFLFVRGERRWHHFLQELGAEPGIAVTSAERGWFSPSRVEGLRDFLAADPVPLAAQARLDPQRIRFVWKPYLALDAISARRRFEQRFAIPAGTTVTTAAGTLELSGTAPYEWIERVRQEWRQVAGLQSVAETALTVTYDPALALERFREAFAPPAGVTARMEGTTLQLAGTAAYEWIIAVREEAPRIPGIEKVAEQKLKIVFDPALVLQRFERRLGLPDTVKATVENGKLTLTGEASHAWLDRVQTMATAVPGITALDVTQLANLDQAAFQQSKLVIENASLRFPVGQTTFASEGSATLALLAEEIRRCQSAARRLGQEIHVEIRGSADPRGSVEKNLELSNGRAEAALDFLTACGLPPGIFEPVIEPIRSGPKPGPSAALDETDRSVTFRISLLP